MVIVYLLKMCRLVCNADTTIPVVLYGGEWWFNHNHWWWSKCIRCWTSPANSAWWSTLAWFVMVIWWKFRIGKMWILLRFLNNQSAIQREADGEIKLKSVGGKTIPIVKKNIYQSRKNLGHHKPPACKYKRRTEAILQVAAWWNNRSNK